MLCYVPKQRVESLCEFVGYFCFALVAFAGWRGLMMFWSAEFPLMCSVAGE